jgi:hypothetical protein
MKHIFTALLLCAASITATSNLDDLFDAIDYFDNTSIAKLARFADQRSEEYELYPIHYAINLYFAGSKNIQKKRLGVIAALLYAKASPNTLDDNDKSPLDRALKKLHELPALLKILQAAVKEQSSQLSEIEKRKKIVSIPTKTEL